MIRRILLSLPLWLAYTALELILSTVGLVLIPLLLAAKSVRVRPSDVWPKRTRIGGELKGGLQVQWSGTLAWLWSNEEDGVMGPSWYAARHPTWSGNRTAFYWSALRNPTNNLRFVPGINPVIDPERIRYVNWDTRVSWTTLTWQGPFAGIESVFLFRGAHWRFWWGWKLKPGDAAGVYDTDMRKPRCGFAIQFKRTGA